MIYLVSGSTASLRRMKNRKYLGFLATPAAGNSIKSILSLGIPWACDNGAFSGFDSEAFSIFLVRAAHAERKPIWVTCPDVVADAGATLDLFGQWQFQIARLGLPVSFVAQDGQESRRVPWSLFSCLFIGGSTEWKLSRHAVDLARRAKRFGKLVHMGRVNSFRRMEIARSMGCDSVDGTSATRWGDAYISRYSRWLAHGDIQRNLLEVLP